MNGRVAKQKRREERESGVIKRKQFFAPLTVPLKTGKVDEETGEPELKDTYIPRTQRRKLMRRLMTDIRKGRIDPMKLMENS